jgi:ribosomal protein S18 acetylase RimI-like enzyme
MNSTIDLRPMDESQYDYFERKSIIHYGEEKSRAEGLSYQDGQDLSVKTFRELLPERLHTKNHFFYAVIDPEGSLINTPLSGWLWVGIEGRTPTNRYLYIWDVYLDPELRGKGHGKRVMKFAEEKAVQLGLPKVRLNVFGHNLVARSLYEKLGYLPTHIQMEKRV